MAATMGSMEPTHPENFSEKKSPHQRKWLRFGLRSVLIVMVIGALLSAWFAKISNNASRQARACKAIFASGGIVDTQRTATEEFFHAHLPQFIVDGLGRHYLCHAYSADFFDSNVTDINVLNDLPQLEIVSLECTSVTDFSPLADLPNLRILSLEGTIQNDLASIAKCTNLRSLYLDYISCPQGTLDLSPLRQLKQLQVLDLTSAPVDGITPLKDIKTLEVLKLGNTDVRSLEPLLGLAKLKELRLRNFDLDDQQVLLKLNLERLGIGNDDELENDVMDELFARGTAISAGGWEIDPETRKPTLRCEP